METKLFFLVALFVVLNLVSAQKKKSTTVTGDLSKDKHTGTRVDLGVSHKRGNWEFNGSGFGTSRGQRGGSLGVSHKRKNFEFGGSVFGDNRGNRGARVGLKWRFRRSSPRTEERFDVVVLVNPCNFDVYDQNNDGYIIEEELYVVFSKTSDAERLFQTLDAIKADGKITLEEFTKMAPSVIRECEANPSDDVAYSVL